MADLAVTDGSLEEDGMAAPLMAEAAWLPALQDQTAPGFPGMTWSAKAIEDENRPDIWLIKLEFRWLESGEDRLAEFQRILPKQLPLRDRVLRFRGERSETPLR